MKNVIIISASSDFGIAMSKKWLNENIELYGTYRTKSNELTEIEKKGVKLIHCDLSDNASVTTACSKLKELCPQWDALILCPGIQDPVGPIADTVFDDWEKSVNINFLNQIRIVHELLPLRNKENNLGSCILFFAGGGTNNATVNYSAYTISKIALIKMCELFDAEITDARFSIVGPGWVKTKIHESTLKAKEKAGDNYEKTKYKLSSNECTPIDEVINCCEWILNSPRELVSGRNFSVVFDAWGSDELDYKLLNDDDHYKLRRQGNDFLDKRDTERSESRLLEEIILSLPQLSDHHSPDNHLYKHLKETVRKEAELLFSYKGERKISFHPFGNLCFPYHSMGNIDSINLFDLDEIIIFSFYWANRKRYKNVLDIGANIGLHSILLGKCGFNVTCFEPDPVHFDILTNNLSLNSIENVKAVNSAISNKNGKMEFIRVLGNTTGSHLSGSKKNPYGDLEKFEVNLVEFSSLLNNTDFIKLDVEGHEKEVLLSTEKNDWLTLDALVEIENENNAVDVFNYFNEMEVNLFAQKLNWQPVKSIRDMPTTYKEGMLFVTCKDQMPWK